MAEGCLGVNLTTAPGFMGISANMGLCSLRTCQYAIAPKFFHSMPRCQESSCFLPSRLMYDHFFSKVPGSCCASWMPTLQELPDLLCGVCHRALGGRLRRPQLRVPVATYDEVVALRLRGEGLCVPVDLLQAARQLCFRRPYHREMEAEQDVAVVDVRNVQEDAFRKDTYFFIFSRGAARAAITMAVSHGLMSL